MYYSKLLVLAAFVGSLEAVRVRMEDNSDPHGRNTPDTQTTWADMRISGFNGADEDEIMDNVFSRFSKEGRTTSGHKTGQKLLMKDEARLAAGMCLEALHKLAPKDVPNYLNSNFEEAWAHYDQNNEGWIRYEETHTFQRYLMGHLNNFILAPGSVTDMSSGGPNYKLPYPQGSEQTPVGQV